ncbi:SET domain-containing protein-lysine N-methyltransferase [Methanothrix sp.]|uniref:SET domain-containing protein-lysine N-methyltransferase n=1 Tax=Methanothrix sp. TaxID=90426 RepID=UPI003C75845F
MYLVKTHIHESGIEGDGVFAGEDIPLGTIIYFLRKNCAFISYDDFLSMSEEEKDKTIRYGVQDESGNWLLGDGEEKLNHSCDANTLSLFVDDAYCDIAVKDISEGEEITGDYSLFYSSFPYRIECNCNAPICRGAVTGGLQVDLQTYDRWRRRISKAVGCIFAVKQNLFSLEDEEARRLTEAIRSKCRPTVFPYVKFSLISDECP